MADERADEEAVVPCLASNHRGVLTSQERKSELDGHVDSADFIWQVI